MFCKLYDLTCLKHQSMLFYTISGGKLIMTFHRDGCNEKRIFIIFIIFIFTRLRMQEAKVNTNCACNTIMHIQACEYRNGNKGFFFSLYYISRAVSNLISNISEFCDSVADDNRVKQK